MCNSLTAALLLYHLCTVCSTELLLLLCGALYVKVKRFWLPRGQGSPLIFTEREQKSYLFISGVGSPHDQQALMSWGRESHRQLAHIFPWTRELLSTQRSICRWAHPGLPSEIPLVSRKELCSGSFTQYPPCWTQWSFDGFHLLESLTQKLVLVERWKGAMSGCWSQRRWRGRSRFCIESESAGSICPHPDSSALNHIKTPFGTVQAHCAFQMFHCYRLSLRPFVFSFDSSSPGRKLKDLLGSLFPRSPLPQPRSILKPSGKGRPTTASLFQEVVCLPLEFSSMLFPYLRYL